MRIFYMDAAMILFFAQFFRNEVLSLKCAKRIDEGIRYIVSLNFNLKGRWIIYLIDFDIRYLWMYFSCHDAILENVYCNI